MNFGKAVLLACSAPIVLFLATAAWLNRPGCFSVENWHRITIGMTLSEVEALLGSPGTPMEDAPGLQGCDRSVWGERILRWSDGYRPPLDDSRIYVGISEGKVVATGITGPSLGMYRGLQSAPAEVQ